MRKTTLLALWSLAATILPIADGKAQRPEAACPAGSVDANGKANNQRLAQDACYKAVDLFHFAAPQLGAILSGGGATQGTVGTLGGLGHFSAGFRANALQSDLPQIDLVTPSVSGARSDTYEVKVVPLGVPVADLAFGLFKGIAIGPIRTGGLDALASFAYLPEYDNDNIHITQREGHWKTGFGGRLGLIDGSATWPSVSATYTERKLPVTNVSAFSGQDRLDLNDITVNTRSWRIVASKQIGFLGLAAGGGKDKYDTDASISVTVAARPSTPGAQGGPLALSQKLDRNNVFGSIWLKSQVLKIVAEAGVSSGGQVDTFNKFASGEGARSRQYFSLGLSFGR